MSSDMYPEKKDSSASNMDVLPDSFWPIRQVMLSGENVCQLESMMDLKWRILNAANRMVCLVYG
jgi:hypothetical protein